jgi:hypothetical protein
MRHDLTDDEAATVHRHLTAAADRYGLPLTNLRPGVWVLRHGTAIPAWVLVWKTKKGRLRLYLNCCGWTYTRRTDPDALTWLCIHLHSAVAGVAALGQEPPCEPST